MKNLVTIVPPESKAGSVSVTQGTRVLLEDGTPLDGVTRVTLIAEPDSLWRAVIEVTPKMGVMKGMSAEIVQGKLSWWRRLLCRMAGVELHATDLDSTSYQYRLP